MYVCMYVRMYVCMYVVMLGLDNRNIDNRYRYSTFSDNQYRDQISICTYAHAHSVQGICISIIHFMHRNVHVLITIVNTLQ